MPRSGLKRVLLGVGTVVLACTAAWAQAPSGVRPASGDATEDERPTRARARTEQAPVGRIPTFGNPPGIGAARTGFVSTNVARRKTRAAAPRAAARAERAPASPAAATLAPPVPLTTPTPPRPVNGLDTRGRPVRLIQPPGAVVPAIAPRRRLPLIEDDPFGAVGVRVGAFVLRPSVEVWGGYDTNPTRTTFGTGSWFTTVTPELLARSDWQRHEMTATLRGSYTAYESIPSYNRPSFDGRITGRVDVSRDTQIDLEGRLQIATDNPGSPDITAGLAKLPLYTTFGGTAGVTQRFNRLEVSLKGTADRTEYQDSELTNGLTASNADRNFERYGVQLRTSYELTPGVKPFVEVGADTRIHDLEFDRSGVRRDSTGWTAKAGTTFELSRKLTGEVAVGYVNRTYKDAALPELNGLLFDASLLWRATGLTTVKLTATTTAAESTLVDVAGVLRRDVSLEVEHAFRRWLIATAKVGYGLDEYVGSDRKDDRYGASLALTYKLTRTAQIKGEFRQEWLRSNLPGNDYTASIVMLGLRLQR